MREPRCYRAVMGASPDSDERRGELAVGLGWLVDRLRTMALDKLDAPYAPEPTRVVAARALAQRLADAAAALEHPADPVWRDLPTVSAAAAGDLLAITGNDLLLALEGQPRDAPVPRRSQGRVPLGALLDELAGAVRELRLRL